MKKIPTSSGSGAVLARLDDGTIQLTITIPQAQIEKEREGALKHLIEDLEIPGFRKGKVPSDIALKHIDKQKLYEHALQLLLPQVYAHAAQEHSIQPILTPRFELISMDEDKDWVVRAITCELPNVNLGDYKKAVTSKKSEIWVPVKDKGNPPTGGEPSREEKEQIVIKSLLDTIDVKIPKVIIEEEVNHKLAQLLDQIQKLGLTIDQYLASTGKSLDQVKNEYLKQSEDSIKLMLILNKIAEEEKIKVEEKEVDEVVKASIASINPQDDKDKAELSSPNQKHFIQGVLLRRKALDSLTGLV